MTGGIFLNHKPLDDIAITFSNAFSTKEIFAFWFKYHGISSWVLKEQVRIVSGNGLVLNRRQVITWTNVGIHLRAISQLSPKLISWLMTLKIILLKIIATSLKCQWVKEISYNVVLSPPVTLLHPPPPLIVQIPTWCNTHENNHVSQKYF